MAILRMSPQKPLPEISIKQRSCLSYIIWYIHTKRISPTHKEINQAMGVSSTVQSASSIIEPLKRKGYLRLSGAGRRNLIPDETSYRVLEDSDIDYWHKEYERMV